MLLLSNVFGNSNSVSEVGWVVRGPWMGSCQLGTYLFKLSPSSYATNAATQVWDPCVCVCANQEHDPLSVFQEEISTNDTEVQKFGEPDAEAMSR